MRLVISSLKKSKQKMKSRISKIIIVLSVTLIFSDLVKVCQSLQRRRVKRIVGGREGRAPPVDDPVAYVSVESREAVVYGTKDNETGYYLFRGIRFAEPPIGRRRFQVREILCFSGTIVNNFCEYLRKK